MLNTCPLIGTYLDTKFNKGVFGVEYLYCQAGSESNSKDFTLHDIMNEVFVDERIVVAPSIFKDLLIVSICRWGWWGWWPWWWWWWWWWWQCRRWWWRARSGIYIQCKWVVHYTAWHHQHDGTSTSTTATTSCTAASNTTKAASSTAMDPREIPGWEKVGSWQRHLWN